MGLDKLFSWDASSIWSLLDPVGTASKWAKDQITQFDFVQKHLRAFGEDNPVAVRMRVPSRNHHLLRGIVLAWCRAIDQLIIRAQRERDDVFESVKQKQARQEICNRLRARVKSLRRNATDYGEPIHDSPILEHVDLVLDGTGVRAGRNDFSVIPNHYSVSNEVLAIFPDVVAKLVGCNIGELPDSMIDACGRPRKAVPQVEHGGEQVLDHFADILKSSKYPEIWRGKQLADSQEVKQFARETFALQETTQQELMGLRELVVGMRSEMTDLFESMTNQAVESLDEGDSNEELVEFIFNHAKVDMMLTSLDQLVQGQEELKAGQGELKLGQDAIKSGQTELKDGQEQTRKSLEQIERDIKKIDVPRSLVIESDDVLDWRESDPSRIAGNSPALRLSFVYAIDDFVGRKTILAQLKDGFLNKRCRDGKLQPFVWQGIFGTAGTGKSRLAMRLMRDELSRWPIAGILKSAYVNERSVQKILKAIDHPALIVVDYAAREDTKQFMLELARNFRDGKSPIGHPLRVLLIERHASDPIYKSLEEACIHSAALSETRASVEYLGVPPLNDKHLRQIVVGRAGDNAKGYPKKHLDQLLDLFGAGRKTPLSAAILGDLISDDVLPEEYDDMRPDQFCFEAYGAILQKERDTWFKWFKSRSPDNFVEQYEQTRNCVALATMVQGVEFDEIDQLLANPDTKEETIEFLGKRFDDLLEFSRYISGYDECDGDPLASETFLPIQPDMIAERFILDEVNPKVKDRNSDSGKRSRVQWLLNTAWSINPIRTAVFVRQSFQDFPGPTMGLNFLLPPNGMVPPLVMSGLLRNIASDINVFCRHLPPGINEMEMAWSVSKLISDELVDEASQDSSICRNVAATLFQLMQIAGRAINPKLPEEDVGEDKTLATTPERIEALSQIWEAQQTDSVDEQAADPKLPLASGNDADLVQISKLALDVLSSLCRHSDRLIKEFNELEDRTSEFLAKATSSYLSSYLWEARNDIEDGGRAHLPLEDHDRDEREAYLQFSIETISDPDASSHQFATAVKLLANVIYAIFGKGNNNQLNRQLRKLMDQVALRNEANKLPSWVCGAYTGMLRNLAVNEYWEIRKQDPNVKECAKTIKELVDLMKRSPRATESKDQRPHKPETIVVFWHCVFDLLNQESVLPELSRQPAEFLTDFFEEMSRAKIEAGDDDEFKQSLATLVATIIKFSREHADQFYSQVVELAEKWEVDFGKPKVKVRQWTGIRHFADQIPKLTGERVEQLTRNLIANTKWPLEQVWKADWSPCQGEDAADYLHRALIATNDADFQDEVKNQVRAVRTREPLCYPGCTFVELLITNEKVEADFHSRVLAFFEDGIYFMDGTSPNIHEMNANQELLLGTEGQAAEYLRLFCGLVQGEMGPFAIVESANDIMARMLDPIDGKASRWWDDAQSLELQKTTSDERIWKVNASVMFGNGLFNAEFAIQKSGMVEMVSDEPYGDQANMHYSSIRPDGRRFRGKKYLDLLTFDRGHPVNQASAEELTQQLVPNAVWPFDLLWQADWTVVQGAEAAKVIRSVTSAIRDRDAAKLLTNSVRAVRLRKPTCYENVTFGELLIQPPNPNDRPRSLVVCMVTAGIFWMKGQSNKLHLLNGSIGVQLDSEEHVAEYLRLFCGLVQAEHGPFSIIDSVEQLQSRLADNNEETAKKIWSDGLDWTGGKSVSIQRVPEEESGQRLWECSAIVQFGSQISGAQFGINQGGLIEMLSDQPITTDDIEIVYSAIESDGFRYRQKAN